MAILDFFGNAVRLSGSITKALNSANAVNGTITGTAASDGFAAGNGANYTLIGGAGDDRYYTVMLNTKIVEENGIAGGIDTAYVISNYVMSVGLENVEIGYANGVIGNSQQNYIVGSTLGQSIEGGAGNDVLTGRGGGDMFVFGAHSGYDVVTDFHPGSSASTTILPDTLRLSGYSTFKSFADVKAAMTQVGNDVTLKLSGQDAVKLLNTNVADFTADNFLLTLDTSHFVQTFNDDFNSLNLWDGKSGGVWRTEFGWGGDRNNPMARNLPAGGEKQLYVDDTLLKKGSTSDTLGINPFDVKDGILTIHARPTSEDQLADAWGYKFTSGMLSTRNSFTQTYGYFEINMQLPAGQGAWPAFWLYSIDGSGSELDVLESHSGESWTATTHDYDTGKDQVSTSTIFTPDLSTNFHKYGVLWTAETVTWYLDGVAVKSIPTPPDMHGPMYVMVNLALDATTAADFKGADLQVDYVKAYALDNVPESLVRSVEGGISAEFLSGTTGADLLRGGIGNDTYYVDNAGDTVVEKAGEGADLVRAAVDSTLSANVENLTLVGRALVGTGNELANSLLGNDWDNNLIGGAGNDALNGGAGVDRLVGGTDNDSYIVDSSDDVVVERAGEGTDVVYASADYVMPANVEKLVLTGQAIRATGGIGDDNLHGNALGNVLVGDAGNDALDGDAGADRMIGGVGNDVYYVDSVGDVIDEKANEGWDAVWASVDYVAHANIEQITLNGNAIRATAGSTGVFMSGNELGNVLTGGASNDTIDGKAGDDRIIGGGGNDKLTGGAGKDVFVFATGFGNDTITDFNVAEDRIDWSALLPSYSAPVITEVGGNAVAKFGTSTITFTGVAAAALNAAGVFDRSKATIADTYGTVRGTDTGAAPAATATGPHGSASALPADPPLVASATEAITAVVVPNTPMVAPTTTVTVPTTPVATLPVVTAPVKAPIATAPIVTTPAVTAPSIPVVPSVKTLIGTLKADSHVVTTSTDVIVEAVNGGYDTVTASVDYTLGASLEKLILAGSAIKGGGNELDNMLVGNAFANLLVGGTGNDTLDGGAGIDTLIGGIGNDSYHVDNAKDIATELVGEGSDTIYSSVNYVAPANVERLALVGSAISARANDQGMYLIGNAMNNVLTGGAGNDNLNGGAGADRMVGGAGNDYYNVDDARDVAVETASGGTDTVEASISYVLGANVEKLQLAGNAVNGTGNELDNTLTGNALANTLSGGAGNDFLFGEAGADKLIGGVGHDSYFVDNLKDVVVERAGEGWDLIFASVDYTASANIEQLVLTGNAVKGTANNGGMYLIGSGLANVLTGGAGTDTIDGKAGDDRIMGGKGNDRLTGGAGADTFVFAEGFGRDVITDFDVAQDHIDWPALQSIYGAPTISDVNGVAQAVFGAHSITFLGASSADLMAHHIFG